MALFRRLFYRKPPDRLLEISERVYVFDCCFSSEILGDDEYKDYLGVIVAQLQDHFPDASFMVCNFWEGDKKSHISDILSEYDMTVMDYPRQYEGCPLLPLEMVHHFLRSCESWLSLEGQYNVLLMHCERGGWPVLAFMLAGLLLYRKHFTGEQKTLEMVYKQAPKELLHLFSPLNPQSSHLRYLQYITRRGSGLEWPPKDKTLMLDCIIIKVVPHFDSKGGCRPLIRVCGQDPLDPTNRSSKIVFSTSKRKKHIRFYKQESTPVKINARCRVRGDVVIECIHVDEDFEHEEVMFRIMFNTAFVESDTMLLSRDEIDVAGSVNDHFPRDFKAEVHFSDFDVAMSEMTSNAAVQHDDDDDVEVASAEEFFEAEEIFSTSETNSDGPIFRSKSATDFKDLTSEIHIITDKIVNKLENTIAVQNGDNANDESLNIIEREGVLFECSNMADQVEGVSETSISEDVIVGEKLITLDNVIAFEEKRMLESSSLTRKTEFVSSTTEEYSVEKKDSFMPKINFASMTNNVVPETITMENVGYVLEKHTVTNGGNWGRDNLVSKEGLESYVHNKLSFSCSSNLVEGASTLDDRDCKLSSVNVIDLTRHELYAHECNHDSLEAYSDNRLGIPSAKQVKNEPEVAICDKIIITEKLVALNGSNNLKENVAFDINFKKDICVTPYIDMEQNSTKDTSQLKCVIEGGLFTEIHFEDDKNDKPDSLISGIGIIEKDQKFASHAIANDVICMLQPLDSGRENKNSFFKQKG